MYESMMRYGFDEVRKQMVGARCSPVWNPGLTPGTQALGTANPSFLSRHLEHLVREGREDDEDSLKCLMASSWALYAGKLRSGYHYLCSTLPSRQSLSDHRYSLLSWGRNGL